VRAALVCGSSQLTYLPNRGRRWSVPCSLPIIPPTRLSFQITMASCRT
jgi:hypothetical protein